MYIKLCVQGFDAMVYEKFLHDLARAGLSVRAFAELIGMNPNSVSNYARSGVVPDHLAIIAALVAEMGVNGLDFQGLLAKVELTAKKPRGRAKSGQFGGDRQVPLDLDE
ncbi:MULTISPECIES: XRE family transcriptional regulator [Thalassospira]|jgi:transcriptional regulator with XRE-family HTH domain|nr:MULTISPECIES: XRE family transcriptional regulator [Thalassospira]|tara:strand:- start:5133 stop:5459 length:327 start_codon:yes stop_codon:yes gene_type:complete